MKYNPEMQSQKITFFVNYLQLEQIKMSSVIPIQRRSPWTKLALLTLSLLTSTRGVTGAVSTSMADVTNFSCEGDRKSVWGLSEASSLTTVLSSELLGAATVAPSAPNTNRAAGMRWHYIRAYTSSRESTSGGSKEIMSTGTEGRTCTMGGHKKPQSLPHR